MLDEGTEKGGWRGEDKKEALTKESEQLLSVFMDKLVLILIKW